ncbi:MAG: PaaI family thioesterase [Pseudomonadota bacterium]
MDLAERIRVAREVVGRDPLALHLGIAVEDVAEARAVVSLEPQPHHCNALNIVHGSTLYALVDQAVAVAANTLPEAAVLVESKINFLSAGRPDQKLFAAAQAVDRKKRLSLWEVKVTDPSGRLVALAQVMAYHQIHRAP